MDEADKEAFEERAAIMEYCGKLPRAVAEAKARKELTVAVPLPPEKQGKSYTEFQAFWKVRKKF